MNIALFGGSFNPVHLGHENVVKALLESPLGIDRVIIMPAYVNPFKAADNISGALPSERLEMCRLAFENFPKCEISDFEISQNKVSYTAVTLDYLKEKYPYDTLFLTVGSDSLETLPLWFRYEDIIKNVKIAAVSRSNEDKQKISGFAETVIKSGGSVFVINTMPFEISSTQIRKKIQKFQDISCYMNENVVKYIECEKIYSSGDDMTSLINGIDINHIKDILKIRLSKKRYTHSINVAEAAKKLAEKYDSNADKAYLAGLLHDICKEISSDEQKSMGLKCSQGISDIEANIPALYHAAAGSYYCEYVLNIHDKDILNSVRFHTTGRANMSRLEEIIYMADLISDDRSYKDVSRMRKLAFDNLTNAMLEAVKFSISDVMEKGSSIPQNTFEAYNYYAAIKKQLQAVPKSR